MSNLFSTIPGLQPSQDEISEAELFVKQTLEGRFPDLDLREGTGLRDLLIRPTAVAYALLKKANDYYFVQNTIAGVTAETPQETVDDILSNWFLTRNTGTYAVISARLYFARQKNVSITTDLSFSPDNTLEFYPITPDVYQASNMTYDSYSNEWYLDVDLQAAETSTSYNISRGSLLYFSNFDPYFLRAEINYLAQEATAGETNLEFIARTRDSISTRNLINEPSIASNLQATFNYLKRVVTVGYGDPDMVRDFIQVFFEPSSIPTPIGGSLNGNLLTLILGTHRVNVGQVIITAGGYPDSLNGSFTVVSITANSVTCDIGTNPGNIQLLPSIIKASPSPTYIHNGGMVDIYCSNSFDTEIIQVTTDAAGTAVINGPVYDLSRTQTVGGSGNDSIPYTYQAIAQSYTQSSSYPVVITAQSPAHGLPATPTPIASGVAQSVALSSLSCVGVTVTAILTSPVSTPIPVGSVIQVSGVYPDSYNGTYTVSESSATQVKYLVLSSISSAGVGPSMEFSNYKVLLDSAVAIPDPDRFVVTAPNAWIGVPLTGNLEADVAVTYQVVNPYAKQSVIQESILSPDGVLTVFKQNHGVTTGRYVTLSNLVPTTLNKAYRVTSTSTIGSFTVQTQLLGQNLTIPGGFLGYFEPLYDLGFSTRQKLEVHFGSSFPNKTASFEVYKFKYLDSVQPYLDSAENRVLCGDLLARGFNFYKLDVTVTTYLGTTVTSAEIQVAANAFLDGLSAGSVFTLSDFTSAIVSAGVSSIKTPIGVRYTKYHRDLTAPETGDITDYLNPADFTNVFVLGTVTVKGETIS